MLFRSGLIGRWMEILANYDFKVLHRAGKLHGNADAASQAMHTTEMVTEREATDHIDTATIAALRPSSLSCPDAALLAALSMDTMATDGVDVVRDWREAQKNDPDLAWIRKHVEDGTRPSDEQIRLASQIGRAHV